MTRLYLLDTNSVSDIIANRSPAARQEELDAKERGDEIAISVLSHAELVFGFKKNPSATRLRTAFESYLAETNVLPWTARASDSYAELRLHLWRHRLVVDTMDLLIAAQAHALGATLVTRDKGFRHLDGLVQVVNWATDLKQIS